MERFENDVKAGSSKSTIRGHTQMMIITTIVIIIIISIYLYNAYSLRVHKPLTLIRKLKIAL